MGTIETAGEHQNVNSVFGENQDAIMSYFGVNIQ